ncbi:MAG: aspartate kinase [Flavobacteriaceae bacterium]|nr:aspartate kinase [Flavobacteriaceae bacterium]
MSVHITARSKSRIDLEKIKKKKINIAIFGHGNVGSILIDQIIASQETIYKRRDFDLTIFSVANSTSVLLNSEGVSATWKKDKLTNGIPYSISQIITFAKRNSLKNLIAIDNTASTQFIQNYEELIENGFHLVSSNKVGNTQSLSFYRNLREVLQKNNKEYLYETNVGAGLPLIDTIKLLHLSGENITRIKGVFSGSLSYIFNHFSSVNESQEITIGEKRKSFSTVVKDAIQKGFTEPDPREDLCGNDVGRKLLILARELDLHCEFEEVSIQNLIPKSLRKITKEAFLTRLNELDVSFHIKRRSLSKGQVLRYVGDLHGDLSKEKGGILDVKLISVPKNSMLGQLKGSDSLFEIYTESYGDHPIIIQGAGAGATVTARGVFGDILRLSSVIN